MKVSDSAPRSQTAEDRFAQRIVARLNEDALDHAVAERLRAARVRAVAARKREPVSMVQHHGSTATLRTTPYSWIWNGVVLLVIAVMLALMHWGLEVQKGVYEQDLVEHDLRLLTDDLTPSAWSDPGFAEYVRRNPDREP